MTTHEPDENKNAVNGTLVRRLFMAASIVLFIASLTQVGFYRGSGWNHREPVSG